MSSAVTSIIICTRERQGSFERALASVLAQDTGDFEIIVVGAGQPPHSAPADTHVPVRVVRGTRYGEGAARAAGLREARGELIAWCDDDDEWSPDHLRLLRDALLADPRAVLASGLGVWSGDGQPARRGPTRPVVDAPVGFDLPAGVVLHRADAARLAGGFDTSLRAYAAGDLWTRIIPLGTWRKVERTVTTHHAVLGKITRSARDLALRTLRREWRTEASRYERSERRLRIRTHELVPFCPTTWSDDRREVIFEVGMGDHFSYGAVARQLIERLRAHDVRVTTGMRAGADIPPGWEGVASPTIEPRNRIAIVYEPYSDLAAMACEHVVRYAMWETTVIPHWQVQDINRTIALLYVPCRENVKIARANGIEVPVKVLHHGVNPERFPLLERTRSGAEPFVFGCSAVLQHRKGTDVLIRAFMDEFEAHEPVRLALKHANSHRLDYAPTDPRITLARGFFEQHALLEYLRGLDAFVLPSRGEGFGLTGIEAMATGLPLIATNWTGPADYLDPTDTYPLRYTLRDTGGLYFGYRRQFGLWAEPDIADLRRLMRHVYEQRDEAADKGRRASARVHRDWTWERPARQIIADFDLLAQGVSPAPG
jgi:glycosyltransferase involved in cell wall biosynthesis